MSEFRLGVGWCAVASVVVLGVVIITLGAVRLGGYVLAGAMLLGGIARLLMLDDRDNGLRIRRRLVDVAFFGALALALVIVFAKVTL